MQTAVSVNTIMGADLTKPGVLDPQTNTLVSPEELVATTNPDDLEAMIQSNWSPSMPDKLLKVLQAMSKKQFPAFNYLACDICGLDNDDENLVVCTKCERALWHWGCMPLVGPIRDMEFYCPDCRCSCGASSYPVSVMVPCKRCRAPLAHHLCLTKAQNDSPICVNCNEI